MKNYADGTDQLRIKADDIASIPLFVAIAYLFNPYSTLNCVAQTSTVWSNLFLAGYFYFLSTKRTFWCCLCLALETQRNFYPFVLIVPAALQQSEKPFVEKKDDDEVAVRGQLYRFEFEWKKAISVVCCFIGLLVATHLSGFWIINDWSYLDATYGFM